MLRHFWRSDVQILYFDIMPQQLCLRYGNDLTAVSETNPRNWGRHDVVWGGCLALQWNHSHPLKKWLVDNITVVCFTHLKNKHQYTYIYFHIFNNFFVIFYYFFLQFFYYNTHGILRSLDINKTMRSIVHTNTLQ